MCWRPSSSPSTLCDLTALPLPGWGRCRFRSYCGRSVPLPVQRLVVSEPRERGIRPELNQFVKPEGCKGLRQNGRSSSKSKLLDARDTLSGLGVERGGDSAFGGAIGTSCRVSCSEAFASATVNMILLISLLATS